MSARARTGLTCAFVLLVIGCGGGPPPSPEVVVRELEARGVPVGEVEVYNEDNDPNKLLGRPGQYVGKRASSSPASRATNRKAST